MKTVKKILKYIFISLYTILLVVGFYIVLNGFLIYTSVTDTMSINDKIEEIKANPNYTKYEDISVDFLDALIAVEDHRFYEHRGVDITSLVRVMVNNIKNFALAEGGSTITQQLARNMYFTQEKKLTRKIAEVLVAADLERNYNKKTILELYINIIYFGNGYDGIAEASHEYFNASPAELTFSQAVYLAGLPQAPSIYSIDEKKSKERTKQVINAMILYNYITPDEAELKYEN
ncbi:MAG: glycosyl transferase [Clostridia bacterium]|nr:glycosyl transferase [Clostridia bacterium]